MDEEHEPVTGNPGWDFATVTTSFSEVVKELMPPYTAPSSALGPRRGWFYQFCMHHDLAKWMNHEKKYRRRHFRTRAARFTACKTSPRTAASW